MRLQLGQKQRLAKCIIIIIIIIISISVISDPSAAVGNLGLGTRLMTHEQHLSLDGFWREMTFSLSLPI